MGDGDDERWKDGVERAIERHDDRLAKVESFQKWQIGAAGTIMFLVGFISDKIKHLVGLGP